MRFHTYLYSRTMLCYHSVIPTGFLPHQHIKGTPKHLQVPPNGQRDTIYWSGTDGNLQDHIRRCQICTKAKPSLPAEPLLNCMVPKSQRKKVDADFFIWSIKFWLLVSNYFSKYLFLIDAK